MFIARRVEEPAQLAKDSRMPSLGMLCFPRRWPPMPSWSGRVCGLNTDSEMSEKESSHTACFHSMSSCRFSDNCRASEFDFRTLQHSDALSEVQPHRDHCQRCVTECMLSPKISPVDPDSRRVLVTTSRAEVPDEVAYNPLVKSSLSDVGRSKVNRGH